MKRKITHIPFFVSAVIIIFILIPIGCFNAYIRYEKYLEEEQRIKKFYDDEVVKVLDANISNSVKWFDIRLKNIEEKVRMLLEFENETLFAFLNTLHRNENMGFRHINSTDIKNIIRDTKYFKKKGYFFAIDLKGKVIVYPPNPEIEGTSIYEYNEANISKISKDILSNIKKTGKGFFKYSFREKPEGKISTKLTFVRIFKPRNWVIGTSVHVSILLDELKDNALEAISTWKSNFEDFFIIIDNSKTILAGNLPLILEQNRGKWEDKALEKGKILGENYIDFNFSKREVPDVTLRCKYIKKLDLTLITGITHENFEKFITRKREELNEGIRDSIISAIVVLTIIFSIIFYASYHFKKQIEKSFRIFSDFFERARTEYKTIDNKHMRFHEFRKLASSANEMTMERIKKEDIIKEFTKKLKNANHKLIDMANVDGLTKVANRRRFDRLLKKEWARAVRNHTNISVCLIDIDHFKKYNDTYGHLMGDKCLTVFAGRLKETLKRPGDIIARYGGEEFVVLLPETDLEGTLFIAEEMMEGIKNLEIPHKSSGVSDIVTFSMGIASFVPDPDTTPDLIVECADKALYKAKESGRNRFIVFEKSEFK